MNKIESLKKCLRMEDETTLEEVRARLAEVFKKKEQLGSRLDFYSHILDHFENGTEDGYGLNFDARLEKGGVDIKTLPWLESEMDAFEISIPFKVGPKGSVSLEMDPTVHVRLYQGMVDDEAEHQDDYPANFRLLESELSRMSMEIRWLEELIHLMDTKTPLVFSKREQPWLEQNTLFLTRSGSHSYGTNIETSDLDVKGIAHAPRSYYMGFVNRFEQAEFREPADAVIYEIQKFFKLAADCNPNIIEVLWTDESDHLFVDPLMERIFDHREAFLSKKAKHSFSGYAISQLKRMRSHRGWVLNPPKKEPERSDFNLPEKITVSREQMSAVESLIQSKLSEWEIDWGSLEPSDRFSAQDAWVKTLSEMSLGADAQWESAARHVGLSEDFVERLKGEKAFRSARRNWKQYHEWLRNRNPSRASMEEKVGYCTKNAMHLVRLMKMAREVLETGQVIVKRPDAEELLAIRRGEWTYDQLIEWAEDREAELEGLYLTSTLPKKPNRVLLDSLCQSVLEEAFAR